MTTLPLSSRVRVDRVLKHSRTISGRRNPVTGASETTTVDLGWFLHLEFDGGIYAFGIGHDKPVGVEAGDMLVWRLSKE